MKSKFYVALAIMMILVVAVAMGNNAHAQPPHAGGPNENSSLDIGIGLGFGQGGDAISSANADPVANALALSSPSATSSAALSQGQSLTTHLNPSLNSGQSLSAGAEGHSVGNVTANESLALAIFSATAAPDVEIQCIEHTAGWGIIANAFNKTGATRYNQACVQEVARRTKHQECVGLATAYAQLSDHVAAYAQLRQCGGVGTSRGLGEEDGS